MGFCPPLPGRMPPPSPPLCARKTGLPPRLKLTAAHAKPGSMGILPRRISFRTETPKSVTNQVTTTSGKGRRSATYSDTDIRLTCGNPIQCDVGRRNRHAW